MSDLLTEVDEAMKQERMEKLWQKYGGFFIGFIAVLILGTAANEGYKSWEKNKDIAQTNLYLDATQSGENAAQELTKIAPELNPNLRGLALLNAAGKSLDDGDKEAALQLYKDIAADASINPLASFMAKHMMTNLDTTLSVDEKIQTYAALIGEENNPWKYHAHLETALLLAHEKNDYKSARDHLNKILTVEKVAESLKKKAQSLSILYAAKGSGSEEFQQN